MNLLTLTKERKQVAEGLHWAKIVNTTTRNSSKGNKMLNICFKTEDGNTFFDSVVESDEHLAQLKLYRLCQVTEIIDQVEDPENVTLEELGRLLHGKELGVAVGMSRPTTEFAAKPQININSDMFYTQAEYTELVSIDDDALFATN